MFCGDEVGGRHHIISGSCRARAGGLLPASVRADRGERAHRFLEEALQLAQANGCSRKDAVALSITCSTEGQPAVLLLLEGPMVVEMTV